MQRLLTRLLFLVLVLGTIAVGVRVMRAEMASTPSFGQAELAAWFSNPTVDDSLVVRRRAARQLDRDFQADFDWQPTLMSVSREHQPVFVERFRELVLLLIEQRAALYQTVPRHNRDAYLDGQLRELAHWYLVDPAGRASGRSLFQQGVLALSTPQVRDRMSPQVREFIAAVQAHLVKRSLNRMLPLSNGS